METNGVPGSRNLGIDTISDLHESLGDLALVAVGGEDQCPWLRVCAPESRGARTQPPTKWWAQVAEKFKENMLVTGRVRTKPGKDPSFSHTRMMVLAYTTKLEAHLRIKDPEHHIDFGHFPFSYRDCIETELRLKKTTWDEIVARKISEITDE